MHPIEHLRYVARASGVDSVDLAREAAIALGTLRADHANLVIACRRIVERHPDAAQLWWLCAHLLTAADPATLAWELADAVDATETADRLASEIPESATVLTIGAPNVIGEALAQRPDVRVWCAGGGSEAATFRRFLEHHDVICARVSIEVELPGGCDLVLLEPLAASRAKLLVSLGSQRAATLARAATLPVWAVAAPGTRLPVEYVEAIVERSGDQHPVDAFSPELLTHVVTQLGVAFEVLGALAAECPYAPELLRTPR